MVYSGGPYVTLGTITSYGDTIGPLNIPYSRANDTLQKIIENTLTATYVPWEWWIDYTGALQTKQERGSDKSGTINIQAGIHIGFSSNERNAKQTKQRIRVIGRGESADQDESTGDWYEDTTEMDTVNSFYEYIQSEKTIASKNEADVWAQVLLAQYAPINQEITVVLDNDDYTTNDFDVGDYITITDSATGLSGKVRVKTIEVSVTGGEGGGAKKTITCTKVRTDIIDRLTDIYKTMQKLLNSSTFIDRMYAEGGEQKKIKADEIEDIWEQTASNKWATELPELETDPNFVECDGYGGRGNISFTCDKDTFELTSDAVDPLGEVRLVEPLLKFSRSPRFTCEFEIDTSAGTVWNTDTFIDIAIRRFGNDPTDCNTTTGIGLGFEIYKTASNYELRAYYMGEGVSSTAIKIANLALDTKYIIEARMEWKEKVVKYYWGKADAEVDDYTYGFRLRAILPMSLNVPDYDTLCPFSLVLDGGPTDQPALVIYRWKTQATRAVKT